MTDLSVGQTITLSDLLKDPIYRKYFSRAPVEPPPANSPPWYVYALKDGRWRRKAAADYREAFAWVKANLREYEDLVINNRRKSYWPPPGLHMPSGHTWCCYCRRPVQLSYFTRHHVFAAKKMEFDPTVLRCPICGVSEQMLRP